MSDESTYTSDTEDTVQDEEALDFSKIMAEAKQLTEFDEGAKKEEIAQDQHLITVLTKIEKLASGGLGKKDTIDIFQSFGQNFKKNLKRNLTIEQAKIIKSELECIINNEIFEDKELEQQMNNLYILILGIAEPTIEREKKKEIKIVSNPSPDKNNLKNEVKDSQQKQTTQNVKFIGKVTTPKIIKEPIKPVQPQKILNNVDLKIKEKSVGQQVVVENGKPEKEATKIMKIQENVRSIDSKIKEKNIGQPITVEKVNLEKKPIQPVKIQESSNNIDSKAKDENAGQPVVIEKKKLEVELVKPTENQVTTNNIHSKEIMNEVKNNKPAKPELDENKIRETMTKYISDKNFPGKILLQKLINEKDQSKRLESLKSLQLQLVPYYDGHIDGMINSATLTAIEKYIEKNLNKTGENILKSDNANVIRCKSDGSFTTKGEELHSVIKKFGDNDLGHAYFIDYPDFEYTVEDNKTTITATVNDFNYFYGIATDTLQKQKRDDPLEDVTDEEVLKLYFRTIATVIKK